MKINNPERFTRLPDAFLFDTDNTLYPYDPAHSAAQQAVRDGFAELIAVSMGPDGAWLVTAEKKYFASAPIVKKKSTVGAGDSMVAGITYMLQQQQPLQQVINFGVACGSAATMNEGTQLFKIEDVQNLYEQMNETK